MLSKKLAGTFAAFALLAVLAPGTQIGSEGAHTRLPALDAAPPLSMDHNT
jgi:hypothetical protein